MRRAWPSWAGLEDTFSRVAGKVDVLAARALVRPSLVRCGAGEPPLARRSRADERLTRDGDPFPLPVLPQPHLERVATMGTAFADEVWDARWNADTQTTGAPDPAAARLFLHRGPARSAVMLVHGYRGGHYGVERWLWPVRRLFRRGHDVALVTLPSHGVRAPSDGRPRYPSPDPIATFEQTRRIVLELRGLLELFQSRGTAMVGAAGASLGGYLVALLATVEARLSFAVPVVPLSDLTDFSRGNVPDPACRSQLASLERPRAPAVGASLLARPSQLSRHRMIVLAARGDRIAPLAHALEIAKHFDAELEIFAGGHLLQPSHGRLLRAIDRLVDAVPRSPHEIPRGGLDSLSFTASARCSPVISSRFS